MTQLITIFVSIFQILLYGYLAATCAYLLVFAVASLFPRKKKFLEYTHKKKFAVVIPCFKEDEVIIEVVKDALKQHYPAICFDVIVIADQFEQKTILQLQELPIILFAENFLISTKTRSINHALRMLPENTYEAVCILDADNLMEYDFLEKMNQALLSGYIAVQGHRIAKNMNTKFAVLDAISEEINNQLFRKGQRKLGLSSALIGSAMAFDYTYFKTLMNDIEVVGGFDKELELQLLSKGQTIEYVDNAYVYDEKVQNAKVFSQQRRRWISAQFHYFGKHFLPAFTALVKNGNVEYFNKAMQYIQLPRVLLLGTLFVLSVTSLLFHVPEKPYFWLAAFGTIITALILAVPRRFYSVANFKAFLFLPIAFLFMFLSLLKIRGANKQFIHTKHTFNAFQIIRNRQKH